MTNFNTTALLARNPLSGGYQMVQLYCYRCGNELDGEHREMMIPDVSDGLKLKLCTDTFIWCGGCGFQASDSSALELRAVALDELQRSRNFG